jgi:ABC-type branched-subunit amino acid transport system ATPase component
MGKIFKLLSKHQKIKFIFIIIFMVALSIVELLIFSFLQPIISYFTNNFNGTNSIVIKTISKFANFSIYSLLLIFFILFLIRCCLTVYISYKKNYLTKNINDELSYKIFLSYLNRDFNFFVEHSSLDMISNLVFEVEKFSYRLIDSLIVVFTETLIVVAIVSFLIFNYFIGTFILGATILIFFTIFYYFIRSRLKILGKNKSTFDSKKINNLQNSFYAIQTIKLEHLENFHAKKFSINTQKASDAQFYLSLISDIPKPLIEFLLLLIVFIILFIFYFFLNIQKSQIIIMLGLFVVAMFRILPSVNKIVGNFGAIKYYFNSVNIISEEFVKNSDFAIYKKYKNTLTNNEGNIEFNKNVKLENINFFYKSKNKLILNNLNLTIRKNECIGILGENGSGKSTLLNIITCLLKPNSGKILLDDQLINEDILGTYHKKIGYISQKTFLINESLIQNIIFGEEENNYNLDRFNHVVELSNLVDFINNLPQGKNTLLGERGAQLSGGETQKIGIARALYKNPEILILDEATNSLDESSEKEFLNMIKSFKNKMTLIIVTHKKDILEYCDNIYVLKDQNLQKLN